MTPTNQIGADGKATTLIHFVTQVDPERIACMPNMTEFGLTAHHLPLMRTNAPQAVTCPACKKVSGGR